MAKKPDQIRVAPEDSNYSMEKFDFGTDGAEANHRVYYDGAWYAVAGRDGAGDLLERIPSPVLQAEQAEAEAEIADHIREKGHDCNDFVRHGLYERDNGGTNDYYYCGQCDAILQVG